MRGFQRTTPLTIRLSRPMFEELQRAALQASEGRDPKLEEPITPEFFAAECVEAILASRRLEAVARLQVS